MYLLSNLDEDKRSTSGKREGPRSSAISRALATNRLPKEVAKRLGTDLTHHPMGNFTTSMLWRQEYL